MIDLAGVRRQDLADLYDRWHAAVDEMCAVPSSAEKVREAWEAFDAIDDYLRAGSVPVDDGPDRVLVRVTKRGFS